MKTKHFLLALFILALASYASAAPPTTTCTTNPDCSPRGPGFICNTSKVCEWQPPIGIPKPSFGIEETYRMYDDPTNRNPSLTYTQNTEGGYYTHYIDNTHPNTTDTSNPYGTASKPRLSIPRDLPEGSVVEVHNNTSQNGWGACNIVGVGTSTRPIFVRGVNMPRVPLSMNTGFYGDAQYLIVEGISFFSGAVTGRERGDFNTSYIAVRNCDFHGDEDAGGFYVVSYRPPNIVHHIVFYNSTVHDNGIWDPDLAVGDRDIGTLVIGQYSSDIWVVDNEMYYNEGDAVQIGDRSSPLYINHIYIGRNIGHHNKQSGFWCKSADDVIFSENVVYGIRYSTSAPGVGMGLQYDAHRIWFLFNEVYECTVGFFGPSAENDVSAYVIGNVIHDLLPWPNVSDPNVVVELGKLGYTPDLFQPNTNDALAAILWYGYNDRYIIGNTIYNVPAGIYGRSGSGYYKMANNIVANIYTGPNGQGKHVYMYGSSGNSTLENNLFYQSNGSVIVKWASVETGDMNDLRSRTSTGQGCITGNPQFTNPSSRDFHLQSTSPAIDAGKSSGVVQQVFDTFYSLYGIDIRKDIEGKTRSQGTAWDIGAYEFSGGGSTCIDTTTLLNHITQWKQGNITIIALMQKISAWKAGC